MEFLLRYCLVLVFLIALTFGGSNVVHADPSPKEESAIEHLITLVRGSGLTFIRNGQEKDSASAADHLEQKTSYAKSKLTTADDFIDQIASKSSLSGSLYLVRLANGQEVPVRDWLAEELRRYRSTNPATR